MTAVTVKFYRVPDTNGGENTPSPYYSTVIIELIPCRSMTIKIIVGTVALSNTHTNSRACLLVLRKLLSIIERGERSFGKSSRVKASLLNIKLPIS